MQASSEEHPDGSVIVMWALFFKGREERPSMIESVSHAAQPPHHWTLYNVYESWDRAKDKELGLIREQDFQTCLGKVLVTRPRE